jgi:hypothetical protein
MPDGNTKTRYATYVKVIRNYRIRDNLEASQNKLTTNRITWHRHIPGMNE